MVCWWADDRIREVLIGNTFTYREALDGLR